jgi:DNA polymerase-1
VTADRPTSNGTVYLLDTHGMVFQMYHGLPPMTAPDGRAVNAVFGVTRAIMDLYDHGAEYLLATFDTPEKTFRDHLFAEYKGHRDPPPDDLIAQEPIIDQVLAAMRIPVLKVPGYEADDVMATVATEAAERGHSVVLCSSDKDCRQLLSDKVTIRNLRKGVTLDAAGLMADWGVRPDQVIDFQALVGDSVDNVKGVPGCGPKTAAKWLAEYGTLDNLIANVDKLGGPKLKEAFKKAIADGSLATSKKLVALRRDVPLTLDWDGWRRRDWDGQRLLELFQELGFRGYAARVRSTLAGSGAKKNEAALEAAGLTSRDREGAGMGEDPAPSRSQLVDPPSKAKKPRPAQPGLFDVLDGDASFDPPAPPKVDDGWKTNYSLIDTKTAFDKFLKELKKQPRFAIDLETTALDPLRAEIVGYAVSWKAEEAYYLAVRGPKGSKLLDPDQTLAALKPVLESPTIGKTNQNIKYDRLVLRAHGVELAGVVGDSMIAHYLLHAGERSHNLDDLTQKYFGHTNISIKELIGKGKKQITMAEVPTEKVKDYAAEDADAAWRLAEKLEPDLEPAGLRKLYDELELPLIDVLAELEFNGCLLDLPLLAKLSVEMADTLATLEQEVHSLAGKEFNLASPKQLREVLFDHMKLPVQKRTGTTNEPSTDQESLEKLAALGHALPKKLIAHRQVAKLKGTYVDALPALVNPKTGRVHTSFNQTVASTGRLSSSDPNLQNIPARTEQGRQIRAAFIAPPGWQILTADYSQVELRLLAHFADDANLRAAFAADQDVHTRVAAEIFKVAEKDVTKEQRGVAKTVNFGVIYGISATGLSIQLGIDKKTAAKFIDDYFARFPTVLAYQDRLLANARKTGYVGTVLGRRRAFDPSAIRPHSTYEQRNGAEREAINMEIQGSAADLMKLAMLNVYRRLRGEKRQTKMLLSVHDELVFEVPAGEVTAVAELVRHEMATALTFSVPLKVDVAAGPNWLDVTEV